MDSKRWIIFIVVVVALFGGLIAWNRISNPPIDISAINTADIVQPSPENGLIGDHTKGGENTKVTFIEYASFQCPGCAASSSQVSSLMDKYGDEITFVFRHFPLPGQTNSKAAAGTAIAAGLQGKFWEMHDKLFVGQDSWSPLDATKRGEVFTGYAKELGLDIDKFNKDIVGDQVNKKLLFDQALRKKDNVEATPTFFLNGEKLEDDVSKTFINGDHTALESLIDELLKK